MTFKEGDYVKILKAVVSSYPKATHDRTFQLAKRCGILVWSAYFPEYNERNWHWSLHEHHIVLDTFYGSLVMRAIRGEK